MNNEIESLTEEKGFSVKQFIEICREQLRLAFLGKLIVYGKVSKINPRGQNLFLELSDLSEQQCAITCFFTGVAKTRVVSALAKAKFDLTNDLPIMLVGTPGVFARNGAIYLNVDSCIVEFTTGKLVAERDKTNERLKKEGLFGRNKELMLPPLPRKLLLLTSSAGTVINDFISGLETAKFGFELLWREVPMQGAAARKAILAALKTLPRDLKPDAVLLFRGGGSNTELAVFNDYEIAKAICLCPVPVLSAIGHQADHSSAQDVSFLALGVPKELGLFFANIVITFRQQLANNMSIIRSLSLERLSRIEERLHLTKRNLGHTGLRYLELNRERLRFLSTNLVTGADRILQRGGERINSLKLRLARADFLIERAEERVRAMELLTAEADPQRQLERGFSIIFESGSGSVVRTVDSLQKKGKLDIRVSDGTLTEVQILKS